MAFTKYIIALGFILPSLVFSADEDCSMRRDPFEGMSNLQRHLCENAVRSGVRANIEMACGNQTNVAWYQDRDNSMSDANDEIGDAMAVILGNQGQATQAIQVCPGVYLATAHGALNNPIKFPQLAHLEPHTRVIHYPMARGNMRSAEGTSRFISPRLRDPSLWERGNEETDYVFIKVDNPVRPNSFVTPVAASPEEMMTHRRDLEVHLYRGKSRYAGAETGTLDFSEENAVPERPPVLESLYQRPQRVNQACALMGTVNVNAALLAHNCPTEQNVSGSSYVSKINGQSYLVGMHTVGISENFPRSDTKGGSNMLSSNSFCQDYQTACGKPCPRLRDVMPRRTVSL